jgi:hypothetical protein
MPAGGRPNKGFRGRQLRTNAEAGRWPEWRAVQYEGVVVVVVVVVVVEVVVVVVAVVVV